MALFCYNITGANITLTNVATTVVIPLSTSPPARGRAVNVTSELSGLAGGDYTALQAQAVGALVYEWTTLPTYATGTLKCYLPGSPPAYTNITRPLPNTVPIGTTIYNTDDSAINSSDGTDWRDAAGVIT